MGRFFFAIPFLFFSFPDFFTGTLPAKKGQEWPTMSGAVAPAAAKKKSNKINKICVESPAASASGAPAAGGACYRREHVALSSCLSTRTHDLWVLRGSNGTTVGSWVRHPATNCFPGHGADAVRAPAYCVCPHLTS